MYDDADDPDPSYHEPRRVLLYHIYAMLDINVCELEFIYPYPLSRDAYIQILRKSVVREVIELNDSMGIMKSQLQFNYGILHDSMLNTLRGTGRREPNAAIEHWRYINRTPGLISPVSFNMVARACLAAQTSSASAGKLFSDLRELENNFGSVFAFQHFGNV